MKLYAAAPVLFLILTGCGSKQIESGLTQQDAQEVVVTLKDRGIDAHPQLEAGKKDVATWEVLVAGGTETKMTAWKVLREAGLPREKVKGLEEVYANSGMIPTAAEEKARLLVGLSGELTRTLHSVQGVVDARVHVVLPENSLLLDKSQQTPPTASVLVKYQGTEAPFKESEIKGLVAKGIEGLTPDNVVVVTKRVELRNAPPVSFWSLGNEAFSLAALLLSCFTGLGSIALTVLNFRLRAQLKEQQEQA